MADSKITALGSIGTGTDPANDQLVIVDVSDVLPTGMATTGTTKRVGLNQLLSSSPTATGAFSVTGLVTAGSATITGDLTVDTNVLKVDTTNNRVGIGTATPGSGYSLDIVGAAVGGIRVSSNNYPNLVIDSANSNGALIYFQEGGTTQARIGHLTGITGLEFSGNNGTPETNVHYGIDATGISTWKNVGGVAGTALTLNASGLGLGTATFGTSAAKVLAIGTGTEPTTGPAGTVQLFTSTRSASNTIPAIFTEGSGVTNAAITNTTVTNKIAIKVNGTIYYLLATTSAA